MNGTKPGVPACEPVVLDQQLALGVYLQALLRPPPAAVPQTVRSEVVTDAAPAPAVAAEGGCGPAAAVRPEWAQDAFQCLLFRVAGLTLALPLARLSGVLPWENAAVAPMPNHQPWFLGLREHLGRRVRLIDVAQVVLPEDRRAALAPPDGGRLGKVILIGDGGWGLACDAVAEVITLAPDAVKWRSQAGSRPWLAGTVIKEMCALIDTDAFAAMLAGSGPPGL